MLTAKNILGTATGGKRSGRKLSVPRRCVPWPASAAPSLSSKRNARLFGESLNAVLPHWLHSDTQDIRAAFRAQLKEITSRSELENLAAVLAALSAESKRARWLTPKQLAGKFGLNEESCYRWIGNRLVPKSLVRRRSRRIRVHPAAITILEKAFHRAHARPEPIL